MDFDISGLAPVEKQPAALDISGLEPISNDQPSLEPVGSNDLFAAAANEEAQKKLAPQPGVFGTLSSGFKRGFSETNEAIFGSPGELLSDPTKFSTMLEQGRAERQAQRQADAEMAKQGFGVRAANTVGTVAGSLVPQVGAGILGAEAGGLVGAAGGPAAPFTVPAGAVIGGAAAIGTTSSLIGWHNAVRDAYDAYIDQGNAPDVAAQKAWQVGKDEAVVQGLIGAGTSLIAPGIGGAASQAVFNAAGKTGSSIIPALGAGIAADAVVAGASSGAAQAASNVNAQTSYDPSRTSFAGVPEATAMGTVANPTTYVAGYQLARNAPSINATVDSMNRANNQGPEYARDITPDATTPAPPPSNITYSPDTVVLNPAAADLAPVEPALTRDTLQDAMSGDQAAINRLAEPTPPAPTATAEPMVGDVVEQTTPNGVVRGTIQQITNSGESKAYALMESADGEPTFVYDSDGPLNVLGKGNVVLPQEAAPSAPLTRDTLAAELNPAPVQSQPIPAQAPPSPPPVPEPTLAERLPTMTDTELTDLYGGKNVQQRNLAKQELDRRFPGWNMPKVVDVANAASEVNQAPTDAQKEAGNYKMGHVKIDGLDISIETPVGGVRSGTSPDGQKWEVQMPANYGYIKRTEGADGDHVDAYIGPDQYADRVYVVDQIDPATGAFDEHKVLIGFGNIIKARQTYFKGFSDGSGSTRMGSITPMANGEFKTWLKTGDTKKPVRYQPPAPKLDTSSLEPAVAPQPEIKVNLTPVQQDYVQRMKDAGRLEVVDTRTPQTAPKAPQTSSVGNRPMPDENTPYFTEKNIIRQLRNSADNDYQASGEPHTEGSRKKLRDQADAMELDVARKELAERNPEIFGEVTKPINESKGVSNEPKQPPARVQPMAEPSPAALEGVPTAEVQSPESSGNAEPGSVQRGGTDVPANAGTDGTGGDLGRGVGSQPGTVPADTAGAAGRGTDAGEPGVRVDTGLGEQRARGEPDTGQSVRSAAIISPPADNYLITDSDRLGQGTPAEKYRDNVAAIKLLRELQTQNRQATPEEQAVLVRYVGWGGMKSVFGNSLGEYTQGWENKGAELKSLLTEAEYNEARESVLNAHFTSEPVVKGMYDIVSRLGFKAGTILEPSMGTGNFFGMMPVDMRSASQLTGVELDILTGGMAKQLYPGYNVLAPVGFESAPLADNHFDLVIGNPPFGSEKVPGALDKDISDFSIHNYFFARSVNKLRPGGVMVMVVTNRFLDKSGDKQRKWIAERAELLGAIRLPNTAFQENAMTQVTTDIIVMRKLDEASQGKADMSWTDVSLMRDPLGGEDITVNRYFVQNPTMMLGRMERSGNMYRGDAATLADDGRNLQQAFAEAIAKLPANVFKPSTTVLSAQDMLRASAKPVDAASEYAVGSYFTTDAVVMQRQESPDGQAVAVEITPATQWSEKQALGEKRFEKLKGIIGVRDATRALLRAEASGYTDAEVDRLRRRLNVVYDEFQAAHGYLNDTTNERVFAPDPDAPLVLALEGDYDAGVNSAKAKALGIKSKKPTATKMPIFRQRVIPKWEPVTHADNAQDALSVTLSERGGVDMQHMVELTGKTEEQIANELSYENENPVIFKNPETDEWETASVYLSGNVKHKEAVARKMGALHQADSLKAVFPKDVAAGEIKIRIGASWVDGKYYADFATHLLGEDTSAKVVYLASTGGYHVNVSGGLSTNLYQKWGTQRMGAAELLDKMLNNREIVVKDKDADGKYIVNKEETLAAATKVEEIREEFGEWIMKDADRRQALTSYYNDKINTNVEPTFDGSHLKLPGMNPTKKMRRHQKNAIWRGIQQRTVLLDHVVGSGKTYTVASTAMELRRTGLAKKPMTVVPNHLVQQWAKEWYSLYPGAKLLTMGKKDFEKKNRRRMLARIATSDVDAVIIAHSSYGFIPVSKELEEKFIQKQIFDIQSSIDAVRLVDGKGGRRVTDLEKSKKNLEARLKKLAAKPKDELLTWEELGIDQLFVDESQEFKNLYFTTGRRGVLGLGNPKGSQKSFDMFIKTQHIQNTQDGKGVIFATGTPISNSLSEMYTLQRYLGMRELENRKILSFDAWMNNFGDDYTDYELDGTAQKYKQVSRLRGLTNMPELMALYKYFADSVTNAQVQAAYREDNPGKEFPIPRVKGGKPRENVVVPRSAAQSDYFDEIVERASNIVAGGKDNMLNITTDARKAALDVRLVLPLEGDNTESKTHVAANRVADIYRRWASDKGTQLVFLDLSIPLSAAKNEGAKLRELIAQINEVQAEIERIEQFDGNTDKLNALNGRLDELQESMDKTYSQDDILAVKASENGFSVYDDMRQKLIDRGVDPAEIAFIHDYGTDLKKAELFDMVNAGKIRVLFGSTTKMGAGTNVQQRLVAEHHIDCPWRPSDIEQREGRIVRQGNLLLEKYGMDNFEVEVLAYATEKTYDARMWQTQEQKLLGIEGLRNYNGSREMDEVAAASASAAEMKAAATGNPLILEDVQISDALRKLESAKKAHTRKEYDLQDSLRRFQMVIDTAPKKAAAYKADAERFSAYEKDPFNGNPPKGTVQGKEYTSQKEAMDAVMAELARQTEGQTAVRKDYSIDINGEKYTTQEGYMKAINQTWGDAVPFEIELGGTIYRNRSDAAQAVVNKTGDTIEGHLAGFPVSIAVDFVAGSDAGAGGFLSSQVIFSSSIKGSGVTYDSEAMHIGNEKPNASARALFGNMIKRLGGLKQDAEYQQAAFERAKKEVVAIEAEVGKPFPKDEELAQKRQRLNQVRKELAGTSQPGEPVVPVTETTGRAVKMSVGKSKPNLRTLQAIQNSIAEHLAKVGWHDLQVVLAPDVQVQDVNKPLAGAYWNNVIYLALEQDPIKTLNHELIHALKEVGAFTNAEWAMLNERAGEWRKKYGIDERYGNLNLNDDEMAEEGIANAFQDYAQQGPIRRIINRIKRFLQAIKEALTTGRWKFAKGEEVFDAILRGEVAPRRNDIPTAAERRVSMALGRNKKEVLDDALTDVEGRLEERVKGFNRKLPDDIGRVATFVLHPHQVATFHEGFTPVYLKAVDQFEMRDQIVHELSNHISMYNHQNADSKEKINAVLELGRLNGKTYYPDEAKTIVVKNDDQSEAVFTKPGESVKLTEEETTAYLRVRRAMDKALDIYSEVLLEEYGMAEKGIITIKQLEKAILAEANEAVREKMVSVLKMVSEIQDAKRKGYVPFKRWGNVGIVVKERVGDGENEPQVKWYSQIDVDSPVDKISRGLSKLTGKARDTVGSQPQVRAALEELAAKYPEDEYEIITFPIATFRDIEGQVNLKDLDVLAASSDLTPDEYNTLRGAIEDSFKRRGFKAHFFKSQNVPGYSPDFERALNDYAVGIAGHLARRRYTPRIEKAINGMIQRKEGERLIKYAQGYAKYITNPQDEFQMMRQVGFMYYISGNLMSALTNITQVPMVTAPWMSGMFSEAQVAGALAKAYKDVIAMTAIPRTGLDVFDPKKAPDDIRAALTKAWDEGQFVPLNTYEAMAIATTNVAAMRGMSRIIREGMNIISVKFSTAERINRLVTFTAAYRLARDAKTRGRIMDFIKRDAIGREMMGNPNGDFAFRFAEYATISSQLRMGRLNRPRLMRNAGTLVFQFKSFVLQILELQYRLLRLHGAQGAKVFGYMMMGLIAMAGVFGLPFADDLKNVIEWAHKALTRRDIDIETELREKIASVFGPLTATALARGIPRALLDVDMSARTGMGDVMPDDVSEVMGIWYDMLVGRPSRAMVSVARGDYSAASAEGLPNFVGNIVKGFDIMYEGVRSIASGDTIIAPKELTKWDSILRMAGGTSGWIAEERQRAWAVKRASNAINDLRADYYDRMAVALARKLRAAKSGDTKLSDQYANEFKDIMTEINSYNIHQPVHQQVIIQEHTLKQRLREEIEGVKTNKPRKQARSRAEEINQIYGVYGR